MKVLLPKAEPHLVKFYQSATEQDKNDIHKNHHQKTSRHDVTSTSKRGQHVTAKKGQHVTSRGVPMSRPLIVNKKHYTNTSNTNNTNNTDQPQKSKISKFRKMDNFHRWMYNVSKIGFLQDTKYQIARFCSTYHFHPYRITNFIMEARNSVVRRYHVQGKIIRFEYNQFVRDKLGYTLQKLLDIVTKDYKKASLHHFIGFLVCSLERFFKSAFGVKELATVAPKHISSHASYQYGNHKIIKQSLPNWAKSGYHQKLHKTPKPIVKALDDVKKNSGNWDRATTKRKLDHIDKLEQKYLGRRHQS